MNRIEKLIKEKCPDGVEWKKIGDIAYISDYVSAGSFASIKANVTYRDKQDYAVLLRFADFSNGFDKSKFVYVDEHAYKFLVKSNLRPNDIVISNVGSCGLMFRCPDLGMKMTLAPNSIVFRAENNSFYYYWLTTLRAQKDIERITSKSAMPKFNKTQFKEILVPYPPLPIQQEIVEILDSFTALQQNLEDELKLRQKQYEHYREKLLTFEDGEVEWKKIPEVANYSTGLTYKPANIVREEGTLVLRSSNIKDSFLSFEDNVFVDMKIPERALVKKDDLLICVRNGSKRLVGKCAMITKVAEGMAFGAFMNILRATKINAKYLYYVWQSENVVKQYKGDDAAPINQITNKDFANITIPVPSLEKQSQITKTLDHFESLISNLKTEIELRKKQYEYYREQLLTFPKNGQASLLP